MADKKLILKTSFRWMQISTDGLLKTPEAVGPYYDRDTTLADGEYSTKDEAYDALLDFVNEHNLLWNTFYLVELVTSFNKDEK